MPSAQFNGHSTLTYVDHIDVSTGKTLVAVPGQTYTTSAAPGRNAGLPAIPGDGRWGSSGTAAPAPLQLPAPPEAPALPAAAPQADPDAPEGETVTSESED